jgi:integrase
MTTFETLLEEYFYARILRPASQDCYIKTVRLFTQYQDILPSEVTFKIVLGWRRYLLTEREIKAVSWNHYMRNMRALFNFAIDRGLLLQMENPFLKTTLRETKKKKKTLNQEQITTSRQILKEQMSFESAPGKHSRYFPAWFWLTIIETYHYTAIRLNQLIHLRVKDIDLVNRIIFIQSDNNKNYEEHQVPIASKLMPLLSHLVDEARNCGIRANEQIFNVNRFSYRTRRQGELMSKDQVNHFFRKLSEECRSRISSHRYRHTVATELMKRPEKNLYVTQKLLGHRDIKVTLSYIEHDVEMLRDCVERD